MAVRQSLKRLLVFACLVGIGDCSNQTSYHRRRSGSSGAVAIDVAGSMIAEEQRGLPREVGYRRRGGPRRRRGMTSIIGEYSFDGTLDKARTGIWRPAFAAGFGSGSAVHLNKPSEDLIDRKKAKLRFTSKNSFLELPPVSRQLTAYTLMFDFFYLKRKGRDGHALLQFATPEKNGRPFESDGIGFHVTTDHKLMFKHAKDADMKEIANQIQSKWLHVGITSTRPCAGDGTMKVFVNGGEKASFKAKDKVFDVCSKTPFINFDCKPGSRGGKCTARLEMKVDNLWTVEDYVSKEDKEDLQRMEEETVIKGDQVPTTINDPKRLGVVEEEDENETEAKMRAMGVAAEEKGAASQLVQPTAIIFICSSLSFL